MSQIYFWNRTLHVSDSSSVHHLEIFTVHTAMVYVIVVCWQLASSQAVSKPVWNIPLLCVQWKTPDDRQSNCLKHVDFYSKNKFEKLVHLVGFSIRIYHDARSPERQITLLTTIPSHPQTHTPQTPPIKTIAFRTCVMYRLIFVLVFEMMPFTGHSTTGNHHAVPELQLSTAQWYGAISQADGRLTALLQKLKNWRILKETVLFPQ